MLHDARRRPPAALFLLFAALLLLAAGVGVASVRADDGEEAPPRGHVEAHAAWTWWQASQEYVNAVLQPARLLREAAATDAQREATTRASLDVLHAAAKLRDEAETAFRDAFEASDLDAWDPVAHADLVQEGLDLAARHALEDDPARAVVLWRRLVATFPESAKARYALTTWLPIALPSTGDLEAATAALLEILPTVEEAWRPDVLVALGDVEALAGRYEAARTRYEEARALVPDDATNADPRGRLRGHLDLRLALVGRPAPAIDGGEWFGGEPTSLEALEGRVVLLDFQATWCGPCIEGLPHLQRLHDELGPRGLAVIGVTREYAKRGVLPERKGLPRVVYAGTTHEEYVAHLRAFRERMDLTIPIWLASKEEAAGYPVHGLPTMVVIDRDGTVGFVAVGGRREHLLRLAVERRLP